jgi:hypothetical protein
MQILLKAVPGSIFRLTDFALKTPAGFRELPVYSESGFRKLLCKATGRFRLAGHDSKVILSLTNGLLKGFSHS